MSSNQAGQQAGKTDFLAKYLKDLDRMIEHNKTVLDCSNKTRDLENALSEYKRKAEANEFPSPELMQQYFWQNVTPLADEVQQLENKKAAANQSTPAPNP